jgi:hypothetical protein
VGVEPTQVRSHAPAGGFEDRAHHRTGCASVEEIFLIATIEQDNSLRVHAGTGSEMLAKSSAAPLLLLVEFCICCLVREKVHFVPDHVGLVLAGSKGDDAAADLLFYFVAGAGCL